VYVLHKQLPQNVTLNHCESRRLRLRTLLPLVPLQLSVIYKQMIILIAPSAIGRALTIERSQHPVLERIGFYYIYNLPDQSTNAASMADNLWA
jgi:hypothetical protein